MRSSKKLKNLDVRIRNHFFKKMIITFGLLLALAGNAAQANEESPSHKWELWTGPLVDFSKDLNAGQFSGNFFGGRAAIFPTIGYFFSDQIEGLFSPSFYMHGSGNYLGRVMFGASVNFSGDTHKNSYFGKVMIGFDDILDNKTSDEINFTLKYLTWSFSAGKRFELNPYVSYTPELNLTLIKESYSTISHFSIVALQFSLFF
jgi:hypothetical protein